MPNKASPRVLAQEWMESLPIGKTFDHDGLYGYLFTSFPQECAARGDSAYEPRWRNDARWAIQILKHAGMVKRVGKGEYRRVGPK